MKKSFFILLALTILTSSCFAMDILTTATTVGQEKIVVDGIYSTTGFSIMNHVSNLAGIGVRGYYGATNDLDIFADYWSGSFVNSDFDISQAASNIGVGLKYAFLKVASNDPIDLSGIAEINSLSSKDLTWGTNTFGVTASKLVRPNWTIFGTAAVLMNNSKVTGLKSVSETDTSFGIGCRYEVNTKIAVIGELSRFMYDSDIYQTISLAGEFKI
jgi:hypothetical protein